MSAPFTPGPWRVGEVRHAGAFQLVTAGDRGYVCEVRCGYLGSGLNHDEREANARLIAAAPELLEALAEVVEMYIKRGPFDEPLGESEQDPEINKARAALAKARSPQ